MAAPPAGGAKSHRSIWRRSLLPASLVLNLFLVALVGGHALHTRFGAPQPNTLLGAALANARASLPPSDAAAFGAAMDRDAAKFSASTQRLSTARQAVEAAIGAEPYDRDAVRGALVAWRRQWNAFFDDFSDSLADALARVSPEGRRKLVAEHQPK